MDRGLHVLLLTALRRRGCAAGDGAPRRQPRDPSALPAQQPQVVEPAVERRDVEPAGIDTENFEAGLFVGTISIEDFGSSLLYGGRHRLSLHRGPVRRGDDRHRRRPAGPATRT